MSRLISIVIAIGYLVAAYFADGWELTWRIGLFLILPLGCIWFSDEMGAYTGVGFGRGAITSPTPGCLIAFGGWLLLFLPVIAGVVIAITGNS